MDERPTQAQPRRIHTFDGEVIELSPLVIRRFWDAVDQPSEDECWEWGGTIMPNGYGRRVVYRKDHTRYHALAHRVAWELANGRIPEGLTLDHLCRNRACVNPAHLEPADQRENTLRSPVAGAAVNSQRTRCINGHDFTPANTYWRKRDGRSRACRACLRETMRRKRASERAVA